MICVLRNKKKSWLWNCPVYIVKNTSDSEWVVGRLTTYACSCYQNTETEGDLKHDK